MKNTLKALLLSAALIGGAMTAAADEKDKATPNVERYNVTTDDGLLAFGKSYYELNGRPAGANGNYYDATGEHPNWSIKQWPDKDAQKHLATYLHFPACQSNAQIQLTTTGAVTFKIKVTCCEDNSVISEKTVSFGAGAQQWVSVMDTKSMPQSAWYKFDIECTSGAGNVGEFFYWKFDQKTADTDRVYTADYMSSPSVHLNGWKTTDPKAPAAGRYDWVYQEVMIPEGDDVVGTYAMSLGILHGYMGIQKDSENDYPIIFSMWDNGNTDTDKNLPAYLRSGALDNEDGVTIARFGGEGTGAQAKRRTGQNWLPGKWVKFVANCRPEVVDVEIDDPDNPGQKKTITYTNTLCTAWYMADGIDNDWQYLATIRQSGANNYFDGWYSFLEDYNWPSGQWARRSYYRNGGLHSMVDGKWYHANEVSFGHTDGGTHYGDRNDYGHGVAKEYENCFYLYSGGYKESVNDTERTLPLKQNIMPLDEATIQRLTARVDQAIKKEQTLKIAEQFETSREQLSATGFTVVGNNSEATNEGETNRATAATDGDENTYWHTRWSNGSGSYSWPYTLDIEVSEELQAKAIEQIAFYQGRGDNYRAKSVEVLVSADKSNWSSLGSYDLANEARPTFNLTSSITGKHYIRLNFTAGYGSFLYLNEVYFRTAVSTDALNEQVEEMLARENQFDGYSTVDLAPLKTAYNNGHWTDAQAIKTAMQKVAAEGTILKFGVANSTAALSSFKSYQIHNLYNMGDVIVRNGAPAVADCGSFSVVDEANNWLILRSEKWNAYYLYNVAAKKYLAYDGGVKLVSEPTPLSITYNEGAFHFNLDASITAGFLSADNHAATVAQVGAAGAAWELRDNYGLTPDATLVRSLLADIEKNGLPNFDGNGYAIRLEGVDPAVYLSTAEVKDNNTTTYSLSSYPEYFKVERNGSGYTITSAHTGKSLGYTNTTSWDVSNRPDVWYFTLGTEPTTIRKAASGNDVALGPEAEANKRTAGYGVFTNKDNANTWVFELYNGEITEPDPEPEVQYFTYKIRSKQKGTYAYINSAAVNEAGVTILGLDANNATTFTFEGTFEEGYKMSATTASGKQYVYAVDGGQDANSNVGLTTDADAATVWQFKYVNSNGGRDNYNIVPKGVGRSWNVRGTVGGVSTIGHWYSGNYDGSLWQVEAVGNENISITYNYNGSFGSVSETYTLPKGSFFPKTLPYGVTAETPTGVTTESSSRNISYSVASDYPLALVADAEDLSAFYNLKIKQGDKHVGVNDDGTFNVKADAEPEFFAFVGTPWGIKIYSYSAEAFVGGTAADNQNVTAAFPQDEAAVYLLEKNANGYAFRVKGTTNGYLNNYGGLSSSRLGYWFDNGAQNDGGSTFIITEVEDPELSFYTIGTLVNLIEWAKEGWVDLQKIEEAVNAILRRKK